MITRIFSPFSRFIKFGLVGTLGFVVDTGVLYACLYLFGFGPYAGRAISFLVAVTVTWLCNRSFTFRDKKGSAPLHRQWALFSAVCLGGFLLNYGTYALLIATQPLVVAYPVLGVAAGSIIGLFFNYFASKHLVFR